MARTPVSTIIESAVPENQLPLSPKNYSWRKKTYDVTYRRKRYYYTWVETKEKTKAWYPRGRGRVYLRRERVYYTVKETGRAQYWALVPLKVKPRKAKPKVKPKVKPKARKKFVGEWVEVERVIDKVTKKYKHLIIEELPYFRLVELNTRFNYDYDHFPKSIYDLVFLYFVFKVLPGSPGNKSKSNKFIFKVSSFRLRKAMYVTDIFVEIPKLLSALSTRLKTTRATFLELITWSGVKKKELEAGKVEAVKTRRKTEKKARKKIFKKSKTKPRRGGTLIRVAGATETEELDEY